MKSRNASVGDGIAASLIGVASASPVYTTITDSSEPSQLAILWNLYGGSGVTVSASGVRDYLVDLGGGNTFLIERVADSFGADGAGATMLLGFPDLSTMSDQI